MRIELERMHQVADRVLENIINEHKEAKATTTKSGEAATTEDLVDVLLTFQEHGDSEFSLTNDNIKAVILVIIVTFYSHDACFCNSHRNFTPYL